MRKKLLALIMGSALILAACSGGGEEATDKNSKNEDTTASVDPEKKYQQKCSMCHGVNLDDGRGNVPELSAIGATMTKEEIEKVIKDGQGTMPGRQLQGEEAEAVAEWLAAKK
ncbi:cytochrome c551 [Robertmurraya andreesenii]|uniref:Cytochrome c551 n=1 Tax=Anoxybacillus andreesenii TaxID=1325932 RepID=A0ABT9V838_9BACL|nr:cytochrome c [Robertmurraya andreesenii]MDQ0157115.1 cytochrome c551 [Robertmurraya andreesenii]